MVLYFDFARAPQGDLTVRLDGDQGQYCNGHQHE
jgi:hypothetical protein